MNVTFYSTHCVNCEILKRQLVSSGIEFNEVNDADLMIEKGFMSAPVLEVDGEVMRFKDALKWAKELKKL